MTNCSENIYLSGVLNEKIGHHYPIFVMSKIENNYANDKLTEDEGEIRPMRFDFCNENTEKFIESAIHHLHKTH